MELSDLKKAMKGVDIILFTPFNKDGSLDLEGMRTNIRWLLERTAGKDFIFTPLGSGSEAYTQSDDERNAVIKMVVEEVNGQHPVMAGTGKAGTQETVKLCQSANSIGADGAMVVLPYYHVPTEEGMYQHYKQVAEGVDKDFGIMIYNNQFVSDAWIKPPLMARLSKIPNIIAVKENITNMASYYAMQRALDPDDMVTLCGTGPVVYSCMAQYGARGFISFPANYAPERAYSIYEAVTAGDSDKAIELINAMAPYSRFGGKVAANHGPHTGLSAAGGWMGLAVIKATMDILGLRGGEVRLPLVGLTEEEKTELRGILRTTGLLK
ncbi:MAG: dihydrodipicolinate synthase family protein [Dehalococcoidia bacterium]|nr:MAG: dihydrodipicolinate synthase family protein [Dehalococcoidia bacterium]